MVKTRQNRSAGLSHVDARGRPRMVDVGDKPATRREAWARATVVFPPAVARALRRRRFESAKGPVFQTAIVAGVAAVKETARLIPFCHPLAIDHADVAIAMKGARAVIDCRVRLTGRTGVEMEALTGATVAALTVYDMCKALSHAIRIEDVALVAKRGGKRDVGPA